MKAWNCVRGFPGKQTEFRLRVRDDAVGQRLPKQFSRAGAVLEHGAGKDPQRRIARLQRRNQLHAGIVFAELRPHHPALKNVVGIHCNHCTDKLDTDARPFVTREIVISFAAT